jgi:hypothetical protein
MISELSKFNLQHNVAGVVKLVDIPDLGSGAARHGGSSPSTRTSFIDINSVLKNGYDNKRKYRFTA